MVIDNRPGKRPIKKTAKMESYTQQSEKKDLKKKTTKFTSEASNVHSESNMEKKDSATEGGQLFYNIMKKQQQIRENAEERKPNSA